MAGGLGHVRSGRSVGWVAAVVLLFAAALPSAALAAQRGDGPRQDAQRPDRHRPPHGGGPGNGTATPIPDVNGPIPITASSRPFVVEGIDLAASGFTLDEYFVSGKANVYDWGTDGSATTPRVRTANAPYVTRMVVRRPQDRRKFSGNVWVELNNPSRNYDVEVEWPAVHQKFLRDGDIVVAITVKPVSIAALKRFDAQRYGPLSMANPLPPAQQACGSLPGQPGYDENASKLYENGLSWDIISQIGALLQSRGSDNPLRGYDVKEVFATGESQTGFYLNTWAANFAPQARQANGRPVYDGLLSVSGAGRTTPINQCATATGPNDPRSLLPKGHVPFIRLDSQSEPFTLDGYPTRRADSDAPDDPYRMYEIAGAAHGWSDIYNYQPPFADIAAAGGVPVSFTGCVEAKWNGLPRQFIEPAAFTNMEAWVREGRQPPHEASPLQVLDPSQDTFATDEFGNVLGGLRTPYVDVPITTYYDWATASQPGGFCTLFGHEVPFTSAALEALYVNHQDYVAKVTASVQQMLSDRWIYPPEAQDIIQEARYVHFP
jgi:hypothetical protein